VRLPALIVKQNQELATLDTEMEMNRSGEGIFMWLPSGETELCLSGWSESWYYSRDVERQDSAEMLEMRDMIHRTLIALSSPVRLRSAMLFLQSGVVAELLV